MVATVVIRETNGDVGSPSVTAINNCNMGSTDMVDLNTTSYPIAAGANSFEKFQRFYVSAMGGTTQLIALKVWAGEALATAATLYTSATWSGFTANAYHTPLATASTVCPNIMPIVAPATPNVGINGVLSGDTYAMAYPATPYSDYIVMQIQTTSSAVTGKQIIMNYQYDEVI